MKKIKDTNEVYHSSDAISASGLKYIYQNSVQKFLQRQAFSSKAMNLGSAVHAAMLEPAEYINDFHVMPKIDGRTKAGKEEKAKNLIINFHCTLMHMYLMMLRKYGKRQI